MKKNNRWANYPLPPLSKTVEEFFGTIVADPYRRLENLDSGQTIKWLVKQSHLTEESLKQNQPVRTALRNRLTALWQYPKYSVLTREGEYYFFWGLDLTRSTSNQNQNRIQNQAVLYRLDSLQSHPQSVLDLNTLDTTGYTSVNYQSFSPDGKLVAYALSKTGSDRQTIKIRSTLDGIDYAEALEDCKFVSIAWKGDNSGFFYNKSFVDQSDCLIEREPSAIFWHTLDTPQSRDQLIYDDPDNEEHLTYLPQITGDGKYLILNVLNGTKPSNRIVYQSLEGDCNHNRRSFITLLEADEACYNFLGSRGTTFYFQTNHLAPHGKVISINLEQPLPQFWTTIIPEMEDVLDFGLFSGGRLALVYLHHACHRLKIYLLDGSFEHELQLPSIGSICGLTGKPELNELFLRFEAYTCPPIIYRFCFENKEVQPVFYPAPFLDFNPEEYETYQVFYSSTGGTLISMFLCHKKGLKLNGANPTILNGYGGFGLSVTPQFVLSQLIWLEQGGILAFPNIRGGGEYGAEWHAAGRRNLRQTSFDDFCQAARFLINRGYTCKANLVTRGGSNGGLLVAACAVQQPELFGTVICQAPVIDMLRYQKFNSGAAWVAEYGCAEISQEEFEWLYAYSPLHNIKGRAHPAFFVMVPLGDERVHPSHGLKLVAALQARNRGSNPILLWLDRHSGHGQGKPNLEIIEEVVDLYTFLWQRCFANLTHGLVKAPDQKGLI